MEETAKKGGAAGGGKATAASFLSISIRGGQMCHGDCLNLIAPIRVGRRADADGSMGPWQNLGVEGTKTQVLGPSGVHSQFRIQIHGCKSQALELSLSFRLCEGLPDNPLSA